MLAVFLCHEQKGGNKLDNKKTNDNFNAKSKKLGTTISQILPNKIITAIITKVISIGMDSLYNSIDKWIHKTETTKKELNNLQSETIESKSNLDSLNSKLETTKKSMAELESKSNLSFTEEKELEKLKEQNDELERSIALKKQVTKAKSEQSVGATKKDFKKLDKDFNKKLNRYIKAEGKVKAAQENVDGYRNRSDYQHIDITGAGVKYAEEEVAENQETAAQKKGELLSSIADYEKYAQSFVDIYGKDLDTWDNADVETYKKIKDNLNAAYKEIYSDEEYNKLVIDLILDTEGLEGIQDKLFSYFLDGGKADETALRQAFGDSIVNSLQQACELAGIEFPDMLQRISDNTNNTLDAFAPKISNPNSQYDVEQNLNSDAKREYFQTLDEETQTLLINTEIPETVKQSTLEEFKDFIATLQENGNATAIANKQSIENAWSSLANTDDEEQKSTQSDLLELAKKGQLTEATFHNTTGADTFLDSINESLPETIDWINSLVTSSDQLSNLQNNISSIQNAFSDFNENGSASAETLAGMSNELKQLKGWDDFAETLGNSSSSAEECRQAMNNLASEYVNSNNFLSQLDDTNKDYYISTLSNMGVENAEEVVLNTLAQKTQMLAMEKEWCKNNTTDLANATLDEINQFITEHHYSKEAATALYQLALEKQLVNGTTLDFSSDIATIAEYVEYINGSARSLRTLNDIRNGKYSVPSSDQEKINHYSQKEVDDAKGKNKEIKLEFYTPKKSASPTGSPSNSSSTKTKQTFDWIEKKLNILTTAASKAKDKIEDMLSIPAKKNKTNKAIAATMKAIKAEQKAAQQYEKYARKQAKKDAKNKNLDGKKVSAKTLAKYVNLVRDGKIGKNAISSISNEKLKTAIQDYQTWHEKSKSAREETQSLMKTIKELYETLANNPIDEAAKSIDNLSAKMNLLESKIKNVSHAATYEDTNNNTVDVSKYTEYQNKMIANYNSQTTAYQTAKTTADNNYTQSNQNLNKAKKAVKKTNNKYAKKLDKYIKNNKLIPDSLLNKIDNQKLYNKCIKYNKEVLANRNYKTAKTTANDNYELAKSENQTKIRQAEKATFDNIKNQFDNQVSLLDAKSAALSDHASLLEAKGMSLDAQNYKDQIATEQNKLQYYINEKQLLEQQLSKITAGTEEWYEAKSALNDVDSNIRSCNLNISNMNNNITELADNVHKKLLDSFSSVAKESEWLANLMSNKDMFNEKTGMITNEGLATLSSYTVGYSSAKSKSALDKAMLEKLQEGLSHDFSTGAWEIIDSNGQSRTYQSLEQLKEAIKETHSDWRDQITETYDYENKIIDMMTEKLQKELDTLKDLIDAKKNALQAEKSLHDYQKSINESTKNISSIQKQITALQGDTSQENLARIQRLQKELAEAQDDLNESEYEHYISDQEEMLDKLYQEYESLITSKMKDTQKLLQDGFALVSNNLATINETANNVASAYGYQFENIGNIYTDTHNISSNIASILGALSSNGSTNATGTAVNDDPMNNKNGAMGTGQDSVPSDAPVATTNVKPIGKEISNKIKVKLKMSKSDVEKYIEANGKKPVSGHSYKAVNQRLKAKFNKVLDDAKLKELAGKLGIEYNNSSETGNLYQALKSLKLSGFKEGGIAADLNKVALDNDDDGWITVQRGEGILTPIQTKTFVQKFVPQMDTIINSAKTLDNLVKNANFEGQQNPTNIDAHYEFNLENCENASDIIHQIQTNPDIKKALQDVTVNQIHPSGTKLAVNRFV